jgi:hypothetical protein
MGDAAVTEPFPDTMGHFLRALLAPPPSDGPPYVHTVTPAAVDPDAPTRCPCGHWTGGDYMCLNGRIYGPCGDANCTGVCDDTYGRCTSDDCACEEDE